MTTTATKVLKYSTSTSTTVELKYLVGITWKNWEWHVVDPVVDPPPKSKKPL